MVFAFGRDHHSVGGVVFAAFGLFELYGLVVDHYFYIIRGGFQVQNDDPVAVPVDDVLADGFGIQRAGDDVVQIQGSRFRELHLGCDNQAQLINGHIVHAAVVAVFKGEQISN